MLIKRGAEAEIRLIDWYGKPAISKVRIPKPYRNSILDEEIRKSRTLHEAKLMHQSKLAGVRTPFIYFVDPKKGEIVMEYVKGTMLKDIVDNNVKLCKTMGELVGKLHNKGIIHGDLTTSNFIFTNDELVLIDFGLSFISHRIEDKAVDIRLIKEVLSSAHIRIFNEAFSYFIEGYKDIVGEVDKVLDKVNEIEKRGRYARVV